MQGYILRQIQSDICGGEERLTKRLTYGAVFQQLLHNLLRNRWWFMITNVPAAVFRVKRTGRSQPHKYRDDPSFFIVLNWKEQ